jgi:predicted nuclease of predicted toxin-antitoxin system
VLRFLADENFDGRVLRGLLHHLPGLDVVTVQERNPAGRPDPEVLQQAASEGRILLSYDRATMPPSAMARVGRGEPMPGLVVIRFGLPIGQTIDDLLVLNRTGQAWTHRSESDPPNG